MSSYEQEITTPLTETFKRLKEQALETGLLYVMDVEALEKLAALNYMQQMADRRIGPDHRIIRQVFNRLYTWLHNANNYFIYRDEKTKLWRLGTELSRRGGGC